MIVSTYQYFIEQLIDEHKVEPDGLFVENAAVVLAEAGNASEQL